MQVMRLDVPIVADPRQALTAFQQVNNAGKQTAQQVTSSWSTATTSFTANARRLGSSSLQIAGALQSVAASGKLGTEQLKQFIGQGSQMAFMFGPQGAIVGSLALATTAIVTHFTKAREEAEKTRDKAIEMLRDIQREVDLGAAYRRAQGLEEERARLQGLIDAERERGRAAAGVGLFGGATPGLFGATDQKKIQEWEAQLSALTPVIAKANDQVASLSQSEGRLARATELVTEREKAAAKARKEAIPIWERITNEIRQQVAMAERLARLAVSPFDITAATPTGGGAARAAARGAAGVRAAREAMAEGFRSAEEMRRQLSQAIASAVSGAITSGFVEAFRTGSIGKGLEALGRSFLAALGSILQSVGEKLLAANLLASRALANLGGPLGIAAAIGLITLGGVLQGAAGAGGGGGRGGSSYVGGGRHLQDRTVTATYNPTAGNAANIQPQQMAPMQVTIIGDPGERGIRKLEKFRQRAEKRNIRGGRT